MLRTFRFLGLTALGMLLAMSSPASAQTDIDDIQVYTDTGAPNSPLNGNVVTIQGVLTVYRGTYNFGTHYVQDATGGIQIFDGSSPAGLNPGDEVSVTGTVSAFGGELQLGSGPSWTFLGSPGEPTPLELTPSQALDFDSSGTQTAGDYELVGSMVAVTGTISYVNSVATFRVVSGTDSLEVFIDNDTGIDIAAVDEGDTYKVISPMVNFNGLLELKPRKQADLIENPGDPFPVVADVLPTPYAPEVNEAVVVSADISDNDTITAATLYYRDAGAGGFTSVAMGNVGSSYSATIPGTAASGLEYYIEATDNSAQTTTVPGDAPTGFLSLAVGTTSIVTIQSTLEPDGDTSSFSNQLVNIEGIVTAPPGEFSTSLSQFIVEEPDGGPWSGIFVFEGSGSQVLFRGDRVRISGIVNEFAGTTQILPQAPEAVTLVAFGQPEPPIDGYSSDVLDTSEALENVLVRTTLAAVADTVAAGTHWFLQTAGADSVVFVDPGPNVTTIAMVGETQYVTGILDGRFGAYELLPRDDADITQFATDVPGDRIAGRVAEIQEVFPNPFNPNTKIKFNIPRAGLGELLIYNARGQVVRTLMRGEMEPGTYEPEWNGMDDTGTPVSSGVYYARLRFEMEQPSVHKLTLVK